MAVIQDSSLLLQKETLSSDWLCAEMLPQEGFESSLSSSRPQGNFGNLLDIADHNSMFMDQNFTSADLNVFLC